MKTENAVKHTPGPWKVIENGRGNYQHGIGTDNRAPIQAMIAYVDVASKLTDKNSRMANARLIAAAPDLLAAADLFVQFRDGLGKVGSKVSIADVGVAMQRAIAKAKGE